MASEARTGADEQPREAGEPWGEYDNPLPPAAQSPHAPGWLRLARAAAGILLLALAWGAVMGALLLVLNTLGIPPHRHVIARIALYVVGALGAFWLGVVALAAVITGAFCLTLALTNRDW